MLFDHLGGENRDSSEPRKRRTGNRQGLGRRARKQQLLGVFECIGTRCVLFSKPQVVVASYFSIHFARKIFHPVAECLSGSSKQVRASEFILGGMYDAMRDDHSNACAFTIAVVNLQCVCVCVCVCMCVFVSREASAHAAA